MDSLSVLSMLLLILQFTGCHSLKCPRKTKWDKKNNVCDDCDDNKYMPTNEHNYTECYPCPNVRNNITEYVIRECSLEEYFLIGCCSHADKNCCLSDKLFIRVTSDGVKVCRASPMPCNQEQFFVSGDKCPPCLPGTYMVDNHCSSRDNQEVGNSVATSNSTSVSDDLPVDTASFNSSNSTDRVCAAPTEINIDEPCRILLNIVAVFLIIILLLSLTERNKLYLSLINYLADKQDVLAKCMKIFICVLAVCLLVTLNVQTTDPPVIIFILLLRVVGVLSFCGVILIAFLYVPLYNFQSISQKASSCCHQHLHESDRDQNETT